MIKKEVRTKRVGKKIIKVTGYRISVGMTPLYGSGKNGIAVIPGARRAEVLIAACERARANSMNARAAGDWWRRLRHSSVAGSRTAGRRPRTSIGGPSRRVSDAGSTAAPNPVDTRQRSRNGSPLSSDTRSG